jgi:tetratricopeptide (TPR) repeat protein
MWGAARDGASAKKYAEAFAAKHPNSGDGAFVLGAYNYYVELAPAFAKVLRFLLFIPAGNRVEGLKQLERAHREGRLFSFPAGMLLLEIYGTFEGRPAEGVQVAERLAREYPDNPSVQFSLAELYANPGVEDFDRAAQVYASLAESLARREGRGTLRYRATLSLAAMRQEQWRLDDAIAITTGVIDAVDPKAPSWVMPSFLVQRGQLRALTDDPRAMEDIQRVLAEAKWKDHHQLATNASAWVERRRASGEAAVYAALLPGNRLTAARRYGDARQAYDEIQRRHPADPQVRYRTEYLTFVSGNAETALAGFQSVASGKDVAAWLKAQAWVQVGRVHDLAGRRAEARKAYQHVVDTYEHENAAWPARLGLITPYKRTAITSPVSTGR